MTNQLPKDRTLEKRNLRHFARRYPQLGQKLRTNSFSLKANVFMARNGFPTAALEVDDAKLALHSAYDPQKEAVRWAKGLGTEWEILVLFGIGLGYHLLAALDLYPDKKILVVDQDLDSLAQTMGYVDLTSIWDKDVQLIISDLPKQAAQFVIGNLHNNPGKRPLLKAIPVYEQVYREYWKALLTGISDLTTMIRSNIATQLTYQKSWLVNFRTNFVQYFDSPGIGSLYGKFTDVPVVVVASGPSLEKNIHLLNNVKGKAVIIAAGSTIGPLLKHGINPDILISIDPGEGNYRHFKDINTKDITFGFASSLFHKIVSDYQGPKFSFGLDFTRFDRLFQEHHQNRKGILTSGATVVVPCFDLAVKLGGNPIILVGQDLAYTDLKSHADGNRIAKSVSLSDPEPLFLKDGINGPVYTAKSFWTMKLHLEKLITQAHPRKVIDATEGGLVIEGTEVRTLSDAIEEYCHAERNASVQIMDVYASEKQSARPEWESALEIISQLISESELIENAFSATQEKITWLNNTPPQVKEKEVAHACKQVRQWEKRIMRTKLFDYCIRTMIETVLKINNSAVTNQIFEATATSARAQQMGQAFYTWFCLIHDSALFLKKEILGPIRIMVEDQINHLEIKERTER